MKATFKLINSYYFKGFFGPFFVAVFPIIILFLMGNITYSNVIASFTNNNYDLSDPQTVDAKQIVKIATETVNQVIAGVLFSSILSSGFFGLPNVILEFKKSTLIKRIGSTNIKKSHFLIVAFFHQMLIITFSFLWIPTIGLLILGFNKYIDITKVSWTINYFKTIPFLIILYLLSLSMGLLIVTLITSIVGAQTISNLIYFPISFLSGGMGTGQPNLAFTPMLRYFSYVLPTKYIVEPSFFVFNGGYQSLWNNLEHYSYIYPIIALGFIVIFFTITSLKFKWGE